VENLVNAGPTVAMELDGVTTLLPMSAQHLLIVVRTTTVSEIVNGTVHLLPSYPR